MISYETRYSLVSVQLCQLLIASANLTVLLQTSLSKHPLTLDWVHRGIQFYAPNIHSSCWPGHLTFNEVN